MGRTCLAVQDSSLWSAKTEIQHRIRSGENCCLQLERGDARALGWWCPHGWMATTGQREVALGSFTAALSLATFLSFLEGLLGQLVASLQPCEGAVGRVLCWEHELGETPSWGETGLQPSHMQQHLRE